MPPTRWKPRRLLAALIRAGIFLVPLLAGFVVGRTVGQRLGEPDNVLEVIIWWTVVIIAASGSATLLDRVARKLLPLTLLLRMTLLFPDNAPSRIKVARRSGSVAQLKKRIETAKEAGDMTLGQMSELIVSLVAALSKHDKRTRGHSERTRVFTEILARELGLPEADRDRLQWAALLHDVGKLEVPLEILNKDGGLESAEWDIMRKHPANGMKLIAPLVPWLGEWAKTVEHHHERWDGTGYPHGLRGSEIHQGARIVAVADAYDVITTGRTYQRAKSPNEARREIVAQAGRQFDPAVARALMSVSLGRLRWATGPLAFLAEIPLIRGIPQVGRDIVTVATSSAVIATSITGGLIPPPGDFTPLQIVQAVVAGDALVPLDEAAEHLIDGPGDTTTTTGTESTTTTAATTIATTTTVAPTTVAGTNSPPTVASVSATTSQGTLVTVALSVSDPDGDQVTCSMAGSPEVGTATVSTDCSAVTYQPPADFVGTVTIVVSATDGIGSSEGTVTITVTATTTTTGSLVVNPDSATAASGKSVNIRVLQNDSGYEKSTLTVAVAPSHGTAVLDGTSGNIRYTSDPGYTGTDSFTYQVCDGADNCATAVVTVTVN